MFASQIKTLIAVTQIAMLAAAGSAFAAGGRVYVADEGANTVSVIDATSFKKTGSIPVGLGPHNVQVSPDGKWVWVTNNGEPGKAAETMPAEKMPKAEHGAMAGAGAVWAIDTATGAVVAKVPVGKDPAHVVVASDGRTAYINNGGDNTVSVLDTGTQRVVAVIPVGASPHGLRISPDGKQVWVANQGTADKPGTTVSVIDVASMKVAATIETGAGAHGVVIDREGHHAFITNTYANTMSVIDIGARKVIATVPVGKGPNGISMAP